MKAKYDIPAIHAKCIEWCKNPVFPYPWQQAMNYSLVETVNTFKISDGFGDYPAKIDKVFNARYGWFICEFAHLIGIDVESYRIKETRLGAVKRYLDSLSEGDPLWEGSILTLRHDRDAIHGLCDGLRVDLFSEEWTDAMPEAIQAYYFLRLDLNPDYQVEP